MPLRREDCLSYLISFNSDDFTATLKLKLLYTPTGMIEHDMVKQCISREILQFMYAIFLAWKS